MHFSYNVSVHADEHMLEAEFHLFRMSPRANASRHTNGRNKNSHLIEVCMLYFNDFAC